MGSSIDMNAGHRGLATISAPRSIVRSRRAIVTWPASPRNAAQPFSEKPDLDPLPCGSGSITLGVLEIIPGARMVRVNGSSVDLGSRAFDLLMVLVEARGDVVSKEEMIAKVWPTTTVVESNLKVQLSILRRALGAERGRIKTVSGRGYMLVTDTASQGEAPSPHPACPATSDKPLVIVIDADPATQALMMRAISQAAKGIEGITRLNMVAGAHKDQ